MAIGGPDHHAPNGRPAQTQLGVARAADVRIILMASGERQLQRTREARPCIEDGNYQLAIKGSNRALARKPGQARGGCAVTEEVKDRRIVEAFAANLGAGGEFHCAGGKIEQTAVRAQSRRPDSRAHPRDKAAAKSADKRRIIDRAVSEHVQRCCRVG